MREQDIQAQILKEIKSRGGYSVKTITCSKAGVPDILACINGRFVGAEIKAPGCIFRVSPLQRFNLESIQRSGGIAILTASLKGFIEALDNSLSEK